MLKSFLIVSLLMPLFAVIAQAQSDGVRRRVNYTYVGAQSPFAWKIKKPSWELSDEVNFQKFVTTLGQAVEQKKCASVSSCLNSKYNIFKDSDPQGLRHYADCADLPYYLRAYAAWKLQLPFSYVTGVTARPSLSPEAAERDARDNRYTSQGNRPYSRADILALDASQFPDAQAILNRSLANSISTATLRTPSIPQAGEGLGDFYTVPVHPGDLRPGTVIYDAAGHAAIVYEVTPQGQIKLLDAHPDNSLTTKVFHPSTFGRSRMVHGAVFKNFRPLEIVGFTLDREGSLIGGQMIIQEDQKIPRVSYEQVENAQTRKDVQTYARWLQSRMSGGGPVIVDLLADFKNSLNDLCSEMKDRINSVQIATNDGIVAQAHPEKLPDNIYGAEGEWENYSTPSRDFTLRQKIQDVITRLAYNVEQLKQGDRSYVYAGNNLSQDLIQTYNHMSAACKIPYQNSKAQQVTLDMEKVRQRALKISFDPYNCIELRWGASHRELDSCTDDQTKRAWYQAQQVYRNWTEKKINEFTGYSLSELQMLNEADQAIAPQAKWQLDIPGYLLGVSVEGLR